MKITFVQNDEEYASMLRAAEAGEDNEEPRDVFIAPPGITKSSKFTVVDNDSGDAWTEEFDTLDGALFYALGIKSDVEKKDDPILGWDRHDALKDWGTFV